MQTSDYQMLAHKTESPPCDEMVNRIDNQILRLLHASMGLCTEAGEFQDVLKKHIFYGKPVDFVGLQEEIGDVMWYVALACNAMGVSLDKIMTTNIEKLRARYPERFTEEKAQNRDLEKERKILEGDSNGH